MSLLLDFLSAELSLTALAAKHNLSLEQLIAWADSPDTTRILDDLQRISARRAAAIASESSATALSNLADISFALARRSELANHPGGPRPPSLTAIESSRRACTTLLRLHQGPQRCTPARHVDAAPPAAPPAPPPIRPQAPIPPGATPAAHSAAPPATLAACTDSAPPTPRTPSPAVPAPRPQAHPLTGSAPNVRVEPSARGASAPARLASLAGFLPRSPSVSSPWSSSPGGILSG